MRLIHSVVFSCSFSFCIAQGGIEHIRNQPYMKNAAKVNCQDPDGDNLSGVICANLQYQASDSLLKLVYEKLIAEAETDSSKNYIVQLQKDWRTFRDNHCQIVWDKYKGGAGFSKNIAYLQCLTELTDHRRQELEKLFDD